MAEEIDDTLFYREDFSTNSNFEVLVAQLGELFQDWDLSERNWGREFDQYELFTCDWDIKTGTVTHPDKTIRVTYYAAKLPEVDDSTEAANENSANSEVHKDLMSVINTYEPIFNERCGQLPILGRLYGLRRFVIMQPSQKDLPLSKTNEFSLFLSAATVATSENNCTVPVFLQIYNLKWNFFLGVGVAPSLRTNFDLIALEESPPECHYLSGLLNLFKEKIPVAYKRPATVSIRKTYLLKSLCVRLPLHVPSTLLCDHNDEFSGKKFRALPCGYFPDSFVEISAVYTWPDLAENIAYDTPVSSDFVPSKAHSANLRYKVHMTSYLTSCLQDYQKVQNGSDSLEAFIGREFFDSQPNTTTAGTRSKKVPGPLKQSEINDLICYVFVGKECEGFNNPESFINRLSTLLASCNSHNGGNHGLAQIWAAFVAELRFMWDTKLTIPNIPDGPPDTGCCLLQQKLQMLNECIRRKLEGDTIIVEEEVVELKDAADEEDCNDTDDSDGSYNSDICEDFYDCDNNDGASGDGSHLPEGRLRQLNNLMLLNAPEVRLYVPCTKKPAVKTEDQLLTDAEMMINSGKIMQDVQKQLLSDMEAFKAANPKCVMEDFIRWHSPKDWEEVTDDDGVVGRQLSVRMQTESNTWKTLWQQAKRIPARLQEALFDETAEAIAVLKYLETRTMSQIYHLTVMPLLDETIAIVKSLHEEMHCSGCEHETQIYDMQMEYSRLLRNTQIQLESEFNDVDIDADTDTDTTGNAVDSDHSSSFISFLLAVPSTGHLVNLVEQFEKQYYLFRCFQKLSGGEPCDLQDLRENFPKMLRNPAGYGILGETLAAQHDEAAIIKDYVIRLDGQTATAETKGDSGAQFMRVILQRGEMRLCCAFTENTSFV